MKNLHVFYLFLLLLPEMVNAEYIFSAPEEAAIQEISEQVLTEAYNNIGLKFSVKHFPNARSLLIANSGEIDGEVSRVEGLDKEFKYLIRIPVEINYIEGNSFVLNTNIKVSNWEDLRKYSLVCVNGIQFVRQNLQQLNINCNYVTAFSQALEMLQRGRVDIAVLPKINGVAAIKEAKATNISIIDQALIKMNLYHYLHKKNKEIIPALHSELIKMQANGRIAAIRKNYLENNGL